MRASKSVVAAALCLLGACSGRNLDGGAPAADAGDRDGAADGDGDPADSEPRGDGGGDEPDTSPAEDAEAGAPDAEGPDGGAEFALPCDVTVPDDRETIAEAIAAAPVPGTVCVRPGVYPESLALRPHVDLVGAGPSTVIEGHITVHGLADADPEPTRLWDVRMRFGGLAGLHSCPDAADSWCTATLVHEAPLALSIDRVVFDGMDAGGTVYCVELDLGVGNLFLSIEGSVCRGDRGVRVVDRLGEGVPMEVDLRLDRNRFEPMEGGSGSEAMSDVVAVVTLPSSRLCGEVTAATGTRIRAAVRNNEIHRSYFQAVYLTQCLRLAAQDAAESRYEILHNSFVVDPALPAEQRLAIQNNSVPGLGPRIVVANNLFFGAAAIFQGLPPDEESTNLLSVASPFRSWESGDLRLVEGCAAIDAADGEHGVDVDFTGARRPYDGDGDGESRADVGAHEAGAVPPD